ncbi:MAG TPA: FprA family A-type flavoprotein [Methanothermococcus okinawensis]|uniref:FprA family A-type flavoprotein n=1 Tax=Methanothermococcus okinawensis TaxID=155863 RepID=A0A833E4B5_9EURY|nr:FprA family A-type flavoprotein [Methanothermococcus okinawensis]HIP91597.1 FprA family A-type flavoprotein [Methanothermococcus okinawensis]
MVVKIKEDVYWIGTIDWDVREFHGYETLNGSTYNVYLIKDEKNVLIDATKDYMFHDLMLNLKSVIDPKEIDYIVINHGEIDHTGSLEKLVEYTGATVITNEKCKEHLELQYNTEGWEFITVDDKGEIEIGKRKLKFIKTPMLHWPDNMVTYVVEDKILFSNDAFGQHMASSERFDYEFKDVELLLEETKEYFANILLPYRMLIPGVIDTLKNLEIHYICPSHGIIWREYIEEVLEKYLEWSSDSCVNRAVIAYDTMYNSTKKMAYSIGKGLMECDVQVKIYNLSKTPMNKVMRDILDAKYVLIGSPTLNSNIYPSVARFLAYMEGLRPGANKIGVAFGSYGWMEMATDVIKKTFEKLGFNIIEDQCLTCRFVPKEDQLSKCYKFGKRLGEME